MKEFTYTMVVKMEGDPDVDRETFMEALSEELNSSILGLVCDDVEGEEEVEIDLDGITLS